MDADGGLAPEPSSGTGVAIRDGLGRAVGDAVALFLALRVVFGLVAIYLWWQATLPGPCHFELARDGWATIPPLADQGAGVPARRGLAALGRLLVHEDRDVRLRAGRRQRQLLAALPGS